MGQAKRRKLNKATGFKSQSASDAQKEIEAKEYPNDLGWMLADVRLIPPQDWSTFNPNEPHNILEFRTYYWQNANDIVLTGNQIVDTNLFVKATYTYLARKARKGLLVARPGLVKMLSTNY